MVAPVEDEHLRAAGDLAGEPDREAVRVGRGQRELPARRARSAACSSAPTQIASSLGSIVVIPPRRLLGHRAHRRLGRVAGHRAGVAEAEVDVLVAVDVDEARAVRLGGEDREAARPAIIQGIGTPESSDAARARRELARARVLALEALELALEERVDHAATLQSTP